MTGQFLSAGTNGLREVLERRLGVFPADASVGNTDAILEAGLALGGDLLAACGLLACSL